MSNGQARAPVAQIVIAIIITALVAGGAGYWAGQRRVTRPTEERTPEIFHWWMASDMQHSIS